MFVFNIWVLTIWQPGKCLEFEVYQHDQGF